MMWETMPISSVCRGIYDGPHATPPTAESGGVFLGIKNITASGHFDFSDIRYISDSDMPKWTKRVKPQGGDIVFSYEATLNLYAQIPQNFYGCLGRRMGLIRPDPQKIDSSFLYYYFFSPQWRAVIQSNTVTGATVDRISILNFPQFPVACPPLKIQKKIASILSAYDGLIENNRRQMKLLEEAAERLYKEWFVKRNINSCIHGVLTGNLKLTPKKLSSVIQFSNGYAFKSKTFTPKGHYKIVTIKNVQDSYFEGSDVDYISRIPSAMPDHCILKEGDILLSLTGNVGRVCVVVGKDYLLNQRVGKVCTAYPAFSYYFLKSNEIQTKMVQLANGSAQQNLSTKSIEQMIVNLPNEEYICIFEGIVQPFLNQQIHLSYDNQLLQEARDRLLPKLMSGEVEV